MGKAGKIAIVVALAVVVAAVIAVKGGGSASTPPQTAGGLPRLVDLGSTTCIPCKMMAPVLEELKKEYAGRMQVDFIDVGVDPSAGKSFDIKLIPTQVFLDASGKEVDRHEGFLSKEDILSRWAKAGVGFAGGPAAASQ